MLMPCVALAGAVALNSCTDSDYDFNQIDATTGIGGDGLTLPMNSTDTIKLADVLELDSSDCVVEEPNGDYVFRQKGDRVDPVNPEIDKIVLSGSSRAGEILLHIVHATQGYTVLASGDAQTFTYSGDKPEEVKSLTEVGTTGKISFEVNFPSELKSAVSSIDELAVTMPSYMKLGGVSSSSSCTLDGSRLVFANVPTSRSLTVSADVVGFDATASDNTGSIELDDANYRINVIGTLHVDVSAHVSGTVASAVEGARITSNMDMGEIVIDNARGRFAPDITLEDLGTVEVTGVPDFLTDGDVCVDLYNPIIKLSVSNDMAVGGFIDGKITSYKNGGVIGSVEISDVPVNASATSGVAATTDVYICRRGGAFEAPAGAVVIEKPSLSELIGVIPDEIKFTATARADESRESFFEFGKQYNVQPAYSFEAPIAFDENAVIVYKDTLDGWNDDIKDFDLAEGAYIEFGTTIENRVPAFLDLTVNAIDADGNIMGDNEIKVEVSTTVLASAEDGKSSETPLTVKVTEGTAGAFKRLDGLVFHVAAKASEDGQSPVVGQTLNAKRHFLIARDIKVTLVGKIIGDFN